MALNLPVPHDPETENTWGELINAALEDLDGRTVSLDGRTDDLETQTADLEAQVTVLAARDGGAARRRAAIAFITKALAGNASVVTMADSKMEGSGIGTGLSTDRSQNRMINALRYALNMAGAGWDMGRGYIPAKYGTFYTMSDAPTYINTSDVMNEGGLGSRSISVELPGSQAGVINFGTLDFGTATSFDVAYTKRPDTADVQVLVDDAVVATINTNNPTFQWGGLATVPIAGGVHNIKVRQTGSFVARIEGIVHRTADQGLVLYDATRAGAQTGFYVPGTTQPDRQWQSLTTVPKNVGCVVAAFGANDMASISVNQWETNIRAIITKCLAVYPQAGFVFLMGAERMEDALAGNNTYAQFAARARQVIEEFEHTVILEEATFWQPRSTVPQDPQGWLADTVHYGKPAGYILGRALAEAIIGPNMGSGA